ALQPLLLRPADRARAEVELDGARLAVDLGGAEAVDAVAGGGLALARRQAHDPVGAARADELLAGDLLRPRDRGAVLQAPRHPRVEAGASPGLRGELRRKRLQP